MDHATTGTWSPRRNRTEPTNSGRVKVIAAQPIQPSPVAVPFTSCLASSAVQVQSIFAQSWDGVSVPFVNLTVNIESSRPFGSGTYNVSIVGEDVHPWSVQYGNQPLVDWIDGIPKGAGVLNSKFTLQLGWNNFTLSFFDDNGIPLTCFSFPWLFEGPEPDNGYPIPELIGFQSCCSHQDCSTLRQQFMLFHLRAEAMYSASRLDLIQMIKLLMVNIIQHKQSVQRPTSMQMH